VCDVCSGTSFGVSGQTVTVGGVDCPVLFENHTVITCALPNGQGTSQAVYVTVAGQSNPTARFFNYGAPLIAAVFPPSVSTAGATNITLSGKWFGLSGVVVISGQVCPAAGVCSLFAYNASTIVLSVPRTSLPLPATCVVAAR
jgi:hypothetical protein